LYGLDDASRSSVSPILGIPDADALALNVLLNNREAQGEFDPMGLAEALSALDAHGFDVTDTGFTLEQVGRSSRGNPTTRARAAPKPPAPMHRRPPMCHVARPTSPPPKSGSNRTRAAR
jgi:hypothetical protein